MQLACDLVTNLLPVTSSFSKSLEPLFGPSGRVWSYGVAWAASSLVSNLFFFGGGAFFQWALPIYA